MSEYESMHISDLVCDEINRTMFLPAIQREFVWDLRAIEKLFDSLLGDYPIGSFLFWRIRDDEKSKWDAYQFIANFNEKAPHNQEANLAGVRHDINMVLDGQQRLTALLIGLKGSYTHFYYKMRTVKLYLNLLKAPVKNEENPEELTYQFEFRENAQTDKPNEEFWYLVGRILDPTGAEPAKKALKQELQYLSEDSREQALSLVGELHERIHSRKAINYYQEKTDDYEKVLEIFIRANTGGKKLDYSDILLSTATAKWHTIKAREEIPALTDRLNSIGATYSFPTDFVLKGCLYLTDGLPIQYKLKTFTTENVGKIEANWENITASLENAVRLVSRYGFSSKNITAPVALLPIAYFLMKANCRNVATTSKAGDVHTQSLIHKWLVLSLLKNAFSSATDTSLKNLRDTLQAQASYAEFPMSEMLKRLNLEASFTSLETDNHLATQYKTKYSYLVLSLLYPDRDWKDNCYHEDHIFPKSEFTEARLKARGYPLDRIAEYRTHFNTIVNLELLTDAENLQKNKTDFAQWLGSRDSNFKTRHCIPEMPSYAFDTFLEFVKTRRAMLVGKLGALTEP